MPDCTGVLILDSTLDNFCPLVSMTRLQFIIIQHCFHTSNGQPSNSLERPAKFVSINNQILLGEKGRLYQINQNIIISSLHSPSSQG